MQTALVHDLLATMKQSICTVATEAGLVEGRRLGVGELEAKLRMRQLKNLLAHGVDVPNARALLKWLEQELRNVELAKEEAIEKELAMSMDAIGVPVLDENSARKLIRKFERERRKAKGECVECPVESVKPAVPGETMCVECGARHRARNEKYRRRLQAHKKSRRRNANDGKNETGSASAPTEDEPGREAREPNVGGEDSTSGARNGGTEVGVAAHDSESGAISHNNGGAQNTLPLPFLRRSRSNERKP